MSMFTTQVLHGYLSYYVMQPKEKASTSEANKSLVYPVSISGYVNCLINKKYVPFKVSAYREMAKYIMSNFPEEYTKDGKPTKRYQVICQCHYNIVWSKRSQKHVVFGVIDYIYPVTNSLVDIANLTGVDKTTEESIDYSNLEEKDLGESDEDWEV